MASTLTSAPLYAAPKEEKSNKSKVEENSTNGNASDQARDSEKKMSLGQGPEKRLEHANNPRGHNMKNLRNEHTIQRKESFSQERALRPVIQESTASPIERQIQKNDRILIRDLQKSLDKLNQSRWAYHPRDERGQGNMGRVDMLDPYGHDKTSDRKELYGNRGRVIREIIPPEPVPEPEPVPVPEPQPEPQPEPTPEPAPDPTPVPQPEPTPPPVDPIPDFPF
jgi:hypothetical protein